MQQSERPQLTPAGLPKRSLRSSSRGTHLGQQEQRVLLRVAYRLLGRRKAAYQSTRLDLFLEGSQLKVLRNSTRALVVELMVAFRHRVIVSMRVDRAARCAQNCAHEESWLHRPHMARLAKQSQASDAK